MCNKYLSPEGAEIERFWHVGARNQPQWQLEIFPRAPGPFIRRRRHAAGYERELVVGQWGLIPWFAKEPKLKYPTNNARSEELADKASYKEPWKRGQRCIIPATSFDEPYWGLFEQPFTRCEWWRFRRADGAPWGLAGLWNAWTDKATGDEFESYTMLTLNADGHPLMGRMHKPGGGSGDKAGVAAGAPGQALGDPDRGRRLRPMAGGHRRAGAAAAQARAGRALRGCAGTA